MSVKRERMERDMEATRSRTSGVSKDELYKLKKEVKEGDYLILCKLKTKLPFVFKMHNTLPAPSPLISSIGNPCTTPLTVVTIKVSLPSINSISKFPVKLSSNLKLRPLSSSVVPGVRGGKEDEGRGNAPSSTLLSRRKEE